MDHLFRTFAGVLLLILTVITGCAPAQKGDSLDISDRAIRVVTTTSMIADLAQVIGGDRLDVDGLMGPGVDPHLYKASEGDVLRMAQADIILYNGLHLEGKMTEVFEQMQQQNIRTIALADRAVTDSLRLQSLTYTGNYDPHVWFDVNLWRSVAEQLRDVLIDLDPTHTEAYQKRTSDYLQSLDDLHRYVQERTSEIPEGQRILITSHDAFGYFGRAYGFEVKALQGLSTATEAGTADVKDLAEFVTANGIPAMFVESSVSPRGIEAVREAVKARGFSVEIGGYLYSDALGEPTSSEGTYLGTVRYNIDTIVQALAPSGP